MNLSKFDTLGSWKPKSSWTINGTRRKRSMLLTWEKEYLKQKKKKDLQFTYFAH